MLSRVKKQLRRLSPFDQAKLALELLRLDKSYTCREESGEIVLVDPVTKIPKAGFGGVHDIKEMIHVLLFISGTPSPCPQGK